MSGEMARYLLAQQQAADAAIVLKVIPGYLSLWAPDAVDPADRNIVTFSGTRTFRNCTYLGNPADIVVGRVLILLTDGGPVILGRLTKP